MPVIGSDDGRLIGYVRASQSLHEFDETVVRLDWGLGSGIFIALILSGIGGVWLTRQAMLPRQQIFQRLEQFTADASHELRSPLMAVKSNVAVALKYPEGMRTTDAEKFNAIASATNQMTRLTEDLLLLAHTDKITSSNWKTLNLEEILNKLILLCQPQAGAKQIDLKVHLTTGLYVQGDEVLLTRIFTNLIENALQYTPVGGTVEIHTRRINRQILMSVQDTGVGIPPEYLPQIFERFWRADPSRSYQTGNSGLGLAIARSIAQKHGGLITVTSQVGVGSCFTVQLPATST